MTPAVTFLSTLRNRIVSEIFGFDGIDFTATSLRVYNDAVRTAQRTGMLADFRPPTISAGIEDDGYMLYDPDAALVPVTSEPYGREDGMPDSEAESEPDEES